MLPAKHPVHKLFPFFIIILCILTRLPQLLSDKLILDGDECVVAIMAKNIYLGKHFDVFFLGQQYGFTIVESLAAVLFYFIFGISTIAVKLAMLTLWTTGVIFLYKTLRLISNSNQYLPAVLTVLFICSPAWAVWSMKARGGYLTAFLVSSVVMYLLFHPGLNKKITTFFLLGFLLEIIFQSQPLWLPGLAPFILYRIIKNKKAWQVVALAACIVVTGALFHCLKQGLPDYHSVNPFIPPNAQALLDNIVRIPKYIYSSMHGNYFLIFVQPPNFFCAFTAYIFTFIILCLPFVSIVFLFQRRKNALLFVLSGCGILATVSYTVFVLYLEPRYLLPLTGFAIISLCILLSDYKLHRSFYYGTGLFIAFNLVAMVSFADFEFGVAKEKELRNTMRRLHQQGINYLFARDEMFAWQVIFYSDQQVLCRSIELPGRYPPYTMRVNKALEDHEKTGFIGDNAHVDDYKPRYRNVIVIGRYYICIDPPREILSELFHF